MVFHGRWIFLIAFLIGTSPLIVFNSAHAAPPTLQGMYEEQVEGLFEDSALNADFGFSDRDVRDQGTPSQLEGPLTTTKTCNDPFSGSATECTEDFLLRHTPASKQVPINAFMPPVFRTKANLLNDANMTKLITDNINSPLFLEWTTLGLAEPSVKGGIASALQDVGSHVESAYLADMHMIKVAEQFPGAKPFVEAYFHCIQQIMAQGTTGSSPSPTFSYTMAQAACRRDGTAAQVSNLVSAPTALPVFAYHPAFDATRAITNYNGGSGPVPGTEITLRDLIFNEEAKLNLQGAGSVTIPSLLGYSSLTLTTVNPLDYTYKLGDEFKLYFGDVVYTMDNSILSQQAPGNQLFGLKAEYKIVDPALDLAYEYSLLTHLAFDYLRHVMYWYCEYQNGIASVLGLGGGNEGETFDNFFTYAATTMQPYLSVTLNPVALSSILAGQFNAALTSPLSFNVVSGGPPPALPGVVILGEDGFAKLSLPQFPFQPILIDVLGHEIKKLPQTNIAAIPLLPQFGYDCSPLKDSIFGALPGGPFEVLWPGIVPTPLQKYIAGVKVGGFGPLLPGTVPDLYKMMNFYARRIALGNILGRAQIARDVIAKLSSSLGSTIPNSIVNDAYKLIERAVGVNAWDLESAIATNVEDLRDYSIGAFMRMQEDVMRAQAGASS